MESKLISMIIAGAALGALPAQVPAQQPGTRVPVPHDQVISANPFLLMWEWTNIEFEKKLSDLQTVGAAGSWIALDGGDEEYVNITGFLRYYPQGAALTGFYIGGRGGLYRVSDDDDSGTAFGLGFDLGYSWLLGARQNFYIGLGIGATRLFGGDLEDFSTTVPNLRLLNVGIAF